MTWDGEDRRVNDHCDRHEANTTALNQAASDIASIKTIGNLTRWIVGILVVIAMAVIGSTVGDIKNALRDLGSDIKEIKRDVEAIKVGAATSQADIASLQGEIDDIKTAIRSADMVRPLLFSKRSD